jgi:transcription elongation factor Elf1
MLFRNTAVSSDLQERIKKLSTKGHPSYNEDLSKYFKCRSCGKEFDSFGDMQKHTMIEHMQKGDTP